MQKVWQEEKNTAGVKKNTKSLVQKGEIDLIQVFL